MNAVSKTWLRTKVTNLYRHKSGVYYARISHGDKKTWRSLKTSVQAVAKSELEKLLQDFSHQAEVRQSSPVMEKMTGKEAFWIREKQVSDDPSMKKSTRKYWNEIMAAVKKSWPELQTTELRKVSVEQCQHWAGKIQSAMSPTRFNNSVSLLKAIFEIAIKKGVRRSNPAAELKRQRVRSKDLTGRLPTRDLFDRWVSEMRRPNARFSKACADLVEFLAYTGVRIGEVQWILWKHCDFSVGEILVVGSPKEATKNGDIRRIPMIPACRDLLERIKKDRLSATPAEKVIEVKEAQKAMNRSCAIVKMERITHHDLRHLFATMCIESGVDIPTVSRWLGHKDGGALAMKVYGHLRNEHSLAAAARVKFS